MSSNCPPQLQLSIQPNTTSFKRSFEQFGFDLESPVVPDMAGATTVPSDGARNERNKRARSASSFGSESSSDLSSTSSSAISQGDAAPALIDPPRLPTPEIQDVEMPDYPEEVDREEGSEQYRLSLERFNEFDNNIASESSSSSTTAPPTLPPLRHGVVFFRHDESSSSSFASTFFDHPPTHESAPTAPDHNPTGFRDRLDTALERLRSPSPLVPGLEEEDEDEDDDEDDAMSERESEVEELEERRAEPPPMLPPIRTVTTQDPPTLPPILADDGVVDAVEQSWHTRTQFSFHDFVGRSPSQSPSNILEAESSPRPFSRSAHPVRNHLALPNPTLGDHPLPSPVLRDLHDWLEERQPLLSDDTHTTQRDNRSSIPSIPTTVATPGMEQGTSAPITLSSSTAHGSPQAHAQVSSESPTGSHQDRLSRMLDRIRTGGRVDDWTGHMSRRPWLLPTASRPTPPVESDAHAVPDLPPWYAGDHSHSPASAYGGASVSSTSTTASRPISTTPALGNTPPSPREHIDYDWFEPVFTHSINGTNEASASVSPSSSTRAPSDSAPPGGQPPYYRAAASARTAAAPGRINSFPDVVGTGNRRLTDALEGLWEPFDPSEILNFDMTRDMDSSPSTSTQNASSRATSIRNQIPLLRPSDINALPTTRQRYGTSQPTAPDRLRATPSSIAELELSDAQRQPRDQARLGRSTSRSAVIRGEPTIGDIFDVADNSRQADASPVRSSAEWAAGSLDEYGEHIHDSLMDRLASAESALFNTTTTTGSSDLSSAVESRPPSLLRHRLLRPYASQSRLSSSNSLVTENASEVRRRADHAEVRRLPAERYSWAAQAMDVEPDVGSGIGQYEHRRSELPENALLTRAWRGPSSLPRDSGGQRSVTAPFSGPDVARPDSMAFPSLTTFVDGLRPVDHGSSSANSDILATLFGDISNDQPRPSVSTGFVPMPTQTANPNPRLDAPSLPPPDLGTSFTAGHQSRPISSTWLASLQYRMMAVDQPNTAGILHSPRIDGAGEDMTTHPRRNAASLFHPSAVAPPDRESQNEQQTHNTQPAREARARQLRFDRRLEVAARDNRVRFSMPSDAFQNTSSRPSTSPTRSDTRASASPASPSTVNPSATFSRPQPSEPRRFPTGDPSDRYSLFDPTAFTAGPFRNTLQHYVDERIPPTPRIESTIPPNAMRSILRRPPPYIPPLSFNDEYEHEHLFPSPRQADVVEEGARNRTISSRRRDETSGGGGGTRMAHGIIREQPFESHSPSRTTPQSNFESDTFPGGPPASSIADERARRYNAYRSPASHMHRYINQQARLEASRVDATRYPTTEEGQVNSDISNANANALRSALMFSRYSRERDLIYADEDELVLGEPVNGQRARSHRRRLLRAQQEAAMSFSRSSPPSSMTMGTWRRGRLLGDFMRDEDFDDSYENLLSLSLQIGDAKPRATPTDVLDKMEKGIYKDWATEGSDTRCPICLDDYTPTDRVQKLSNCSHWLHQDCLTQWLQSASTCPVCRGSVNAPSPSPFGAPTRQPRHRGMNPFGLLRRMDPPPTAVRPSPTSESPRRPTHPSAPAAPGANENRHNNNRNPDQGNNDAQESPSRHEFGAPWRYPRM